MNPLFAQRNIPGASGVGGGSCIFLLMELIVAVTQKFFSGPFHTDVAILPPGFSTRTISLAAISISGKNIKPKRQLIASKVLSANGISLTSHAFVSKFFIPRL